MGDMSINLASLPMGADPKTDQVVAWDELGRSIYQSQFGVQYFIEATAPPKGSAIRGAYNSLVQDPGGTLGAVGKNALAGMWGAVETPMNALRGMPITNGDVWNSAGLVSVGGAGMAAPEGALRSNSFRAYHGSPHSFDKFSLDKIGTGEGAQAYGNGLYFAENEGVARGYRDALSNPDAVPLHYNGKPVDTPWNADIRERWADEFKGLNEADADAMEELIGNLSQVNSLSDVKNVLDNVSARAKILYYNRVKKNLVKPDVGKGSMYEVEVNANPDHFLDFDKPLSEQSQAVKDALDKRYGRYLTSIFGENATGADVARRVESREHLSEMTAAGIPGVKYADAGSRGPSTIYNVGSPRDGFGPYSPYNTMADAQAQADLLRSYGFADAEIKPQVQPQTSNYVVFNDDILNILRKYGIAGGATGLGVVGAAQQDKGQY